MSANYLGDSTISNVELFNIRASAASVFNANALTGVTSFTSDGSVDTLGITNIGSAATQIGLKNISTNAADVTATFADAALTGTNDTVTVNLSSAGNTAANGSDLTVITTAAAANGAETLAVAATGTNFLGVLASQGFGGGTVLKTLNVSGAGSLTVATALDFQGTTGGVLNASTMTGALSVGFAVADTGLSVTGGAGSDTFAFTTGLDTAETVNGGDGSDTVSMTNMDTFTLASFKITNVEVFDQQSTTNVDLSMVTGGTALTKVVLRENATASKAMSAADLAAGVAVDLLQTTGVVGGETVTLGLKDASGTADALTVTMKGVSANANNTVASLTVANIETLNLVSSRASSTGAALNTVTGDQNILTSLAAGTALTSINASGSDALTISVSATATKLTKVDGAAMTADLSVTLADGDVSLTGGSGDDTFVFAATLNNKDTVVGGTNTLSTTEDLLTATVTDLTATTGALSISGVERINLTNAGTAVIDATKITGATEIAVDGASTATTISGLSSGAKIGLGFKGANVTDARGTLPLTLADATGTADTVTLNVNEVTDADVSTVTLKTTAIETVNLAYSTTLAAMGNLTVVATDLTATTINVTGSDADADNTTTLGTLNAATTTVDASTFKGVLSVSAASGTGATTIKANGLVANNITGSGFADTVTIGAATNTLVQTVAGGAGTDTLNISLKTGNQSLASVSAVEVINITVADSAAVVLTSVVGIEDAAATTLTVTGGNTLSTFTNTDTIAATTALTKIDASGFKGDTTLLFASNTLTSVNVITGGASTKDTVNTIINSSANTFKMSAIETLSVQNLVGASSINLTDVTGLTNLIINDAATGTGNITLTGFDVANTKLTLGVGVDGTATTDVDNVSIIVTGANVTGAADTLNVTVQNVETTATLSANGVETLNLAIASDTAALQALNVTNTNATNKYVTNVTGGTSAQGFTLSSLSADASTLNASTFIGNLTLSAAARLGTTAMTLTGGTGTDALNMKQANDVIDGGTGTDTLSIAQNAVLGGFLIDLSSTVDQVTTYNGSANSAVQKGFENVDMSGVTGTFGADITARAAGSTITGTGNADVITGGAGNDTVIAQAGTGEDDNVNTGGGNDIVSFTITAFADRDQAGNTGTYDFAGGTADVVSFSDAGTIADADFARLTNVESVQLANGTNSLTVGTAAAAAGILVLNGGTGVDTITSGAAANTIIGGAGADVLVGGGGADTYVFAATGALNGNDVFAANIVGGAGGDILDFRAMGTFTLLSATATEHDGTANTAIANKVVLLASADGGVVAVDSAAEVAALIDGAGDAMELVSGGKAIIIAGDNSAATAGALIYLVDDTLGAVAGTISADDIVIIGNATLDIDTVLAANLLLA